MWQSLPQTSLPLPREEPMQNSSISERQIFLRSSVAMNVANHFGGLRPSLSIGLSSSKKSYTSLNWR
jgi:hypothetical protein